MNIYSPSRPTLAGRPLFENGLSVVPVIQVWPLEDQAKVRLTLMLPVDLGQMQSAQFHTEVLSDDLGLILLAYQEDPEALVETLFPSSPGGLEPQVRTRPKRTAKPQAPLLGPTADLSELEALDEDEDLDLTSDLASLAELETI